jgi:hypothetical protein
MPKNLVEAGKYATHYNKDYQMFNPVITTGPSVLLPIAFFFKLFGINYVVARLLMIVFYLLFLIILYFLVREFFGSFVAALSSISIGFLPTTFIMAINTLGEIPATLYLLFGFLMLKLHDKHNNKKWLIISGISFGLSVLSKQIFIISIVPIITYIIFTKEFKSRVSLLASFILTVLLWEVYQIWTLGIRGYIHLKISAPQYLMSQGASLNASIDTLLISKLQLISDAFKINVVILCTIIFILSIFITIIIINNSKKKNAVLIAYILFIVASLAVWLIFINRVSFRHVYSYTVLIMPLFFYMIHWFYKESPQIMNLDTSIKRICILLIASLVIITPMFSSIQIIKGSYSFYQNQHRTLQNQLQFIEEFKRDIPANSSIGYWDWWNAPEITFFVDNDFIDVSGIYSVIHVEGRDTLPEYFITDFYQVRLDPTFIQLKPMISNKVLSSEDNEAVSLYYLNKNSLLTTQKYIWIPDSATIALNVSEMKKYNMTLNLVSFYKTRKLNLYVNGLNMYQENIPPEYTKINTQVVLKKGENEIKIYTPDGAQRPCDIPSQKNPDRRSLGFAFYNISIN